VQLVKEVLVIVELSLLVDASLKPVWPKPSLRKKCQVRKEYIFDYNVESIHDLTKIKFQVGDVPGVRNWFS